jgi:CBS domain-containing protein
MILIKHTLAQKTRPLTTVTPGDTVQRAAELMLDRDIGAVMVLDGSKLIGIFTERDCLHKVTAVGRDPRDVSRITRHLQIAWLKVNTRSNSAALFHMSETIRVRICCRSTSVQRERSSISQADSDMSCA